MVDDNFDLSKMDFSKMGELMKQAQAVQQKMKWTQTELSSAQVTGSAGGNLIKVIMNGRHRVIKIELSDDLLRESKEIIQDLLVSATNDAIEKVEKLVQEKMAKLAKDFGVPEGMAGAGGFGG